MPTKREREYYAMGFRDGEASHRMRERGRPVSSMEFFEGERFDYGPPTMRKPTRKLSAWQKYIKNKRNHITYRDGKLNLKAMGVQYRKKKRR